MPAFFRGARTVRALPDSLASPIGVRCVRFWRLKRVCTRRASTGAQGFLSFAVMRAMVLDAPKLPLQLRNVPKLRPEPGQLLLRVSACAVCRTDLHIVDGELPATRLPLIPGHEVIGRVEEIGCDVKKFRENDRVGIPWLGWTCGECKFCRSRRENLCNR